MVLGRRDCREEGQVYPALLLAIIGGLAIALGFIGLQNLMDQGGRANSASDAAALAVGSQFRDDALTSLGVAGPGNHLGELLGTLDSLMNNGGSWPGADAVAGEYARANGAQLDGDVEYQGFDPQAHRWVWRVVTEQLDTVHGGTESARSRSASRVAVDLAGALCQGGLVLNGSCVTPGQWAKDCLAPPPPPPPPSPTAGGGGGGKPSESPSASPNPSPSPTFTPAPYCDFNILDLLKMRVQLIN